MALSTPLPKPVTLCVTHFTVEQDDDSTLSLFRESGEDHTAWALRCKHAALEALNHRFGEEKCWKSPTVPYLDYLIIHGLGDDLMASCIPPIPRSFTRVMTTFEVQAVQRKLRLIHERREALGLRVVYAFEANLERATNRVKQLMERMNLEYQNGPASPRKTPLQWTGRKVPVRRVTPTTPLPPPLPPPPPPPLRPLSLPTPAPAPVLFSSYSPSVPAHNSFVFCPLLVPSPGQPRPRIVWAAPPPPPPPPQTPTPLSTKTGKKFTKAVQGIITKQQRKQVTGNAEDLLLMLRRSTQQ